MNELGAGPQHLRERVQSQPTFELACKALEELKADARKRHKELVFQWHPDRHPDNVEEMTLKLKALNRIAEDLDKLKLQHQVRRPRPPVMRVVHFYQASPFGSTVTTGTPFTGFHPTSNTGASTPTYDARRAVFIRFR
jgi:hypothetical protein